MSEGWVTLLQQQWGLKVWGHEIEHQNHLYSFAWRLYSWQLAIMFSIINVSNNYKMDHSYNDNDRSSPFKQNSIWKYACWRLSVTNQKFSSAEGHKHEGGASSIVFHRPHPPGETFFSANTWKKEVAPDNEILNRWTLEVMLTSMSMLTLRKLTRRPKRKRQKVKMMVTGLLGGRSLAQGSERKFSKLWNIIIDSRSHLLLRAAVN